MTPRLVAVAVGCLVTLSAASAQAQQAPAASRLTGRTPDTPRHAASQSAAARATNICSGLWSGGLSLAQIEADLADPSDTGIAKTFRTDIDEAAKTVSVTYDAKMPPRIVVWRPVLGCAQLPVGATIEAAKALPQVKSNVRAPNLDDKPWPTGDRDAVAALPPAQQTALDRVVASAFDGKTYAGAKTWGVIVVKDGKIVAERYDRGFDLHKGSQTHSAAKSFAASVVGLATAKIGYDLKKAPALSEWDRPGDPRRAIRPEHLIHMSSGLYGEGTGSPQTDIYFQGATVAGRAATNLLDTMPGTRFLYNPPDTMLMMRSVREAMKDDARYWAFPYTELFWKIGMTRTTSVSDWNGDFLMSGQSWSTARDFARFGLLYLNDGVWQGRRILPAGWARYVSTPAPAQPDGNGARYGGHFWLYGGQSGLAADAYSPAGGQGQYAMIIPSRNVVIVRRGYDAGQGFQIAKFCADVLAAMD